MPVVSDLCGVVLGGRYELQALVGEGAFGRVYRARDRRLDRLVAVKVMRTAASPEHGEAADVEREARLLARLSDPGIVAVHDIGEDPEGAYCVSELIDGEDLARRLAAAPLTAAAARSIAVGMCRGLAAAHALGIVHRDVTPGNVLIARDGAVKVADFGVARLAEGAGGATTPESLVVGTPRYMAPEQARGDAVTPAADVYSAGVVLYEMLVGRAPFHGESAVALALAHLSAPPPPLPDTITPSLRQVVMRALAKDPAARYPDAAAMADALDHAGEPAPTGPVTTLRQPRRGRIRVFHPAARRRSAALVGAVALVCGALAAGALTGEHRAQSRGTLARAVVRPIDVPLVVEEDVAAATARLRGEGLRVAVAEIPAPGIRPGTVTSQTPAPGAAASPGSLVRLAVSEVPRWRTVATVTARTSAALRIRGLRWRIVASASHARSCTLWVFCHRSSASVSRAGASSALATVALSGSPTTHVFDSGPGDYRVTVAPASGETRWTVRVQDDY